MLDDPFLAQLMLNDLRSVIASRTSYQIYRRPEPLPISRWVAASLLQKAIRRGRLDLALRAASTLLAVDEKRLWRRLALIGAEDVGLGDIVAVGLATAAFVSKGRRAEFGDDWVIACCLVSRLAAANKCRATDDLALICEVHPACVDLRLELQEKPTEALIDIILSSTMPFLDRAVALSCALGGPSRSKQRTARRHRAEDVFAAFAESGWSGSLTALARRSYFTTGELLGPYLLLLSREFTLPGIIRADSLPVEAAVGPVPGWAYDQFSHEGRQALLRFLQSGAPSALWLKANLLAKWRLPVLGHLLFRIEGGRVNLRLRWPLAEKLRRDADLFCSGHGCPDSGEVLRLLWGDLPVLNQIRAELSRPSPMGEERLEQPVPEPQQLELPATAEI